MMIYLHVNGKGSLVLLLKYIEFSKGLPVLQQDLM